MSINVPQKPYLIRALNNWIIDSKGLTYIQIDTEVLDHLRGSIPTKFLKSKNLTLNISKESVINLVIENDKITYLRGRKIPNGNEVTGSKYILSINM